MNTDKEGVRINKIKLNVPTAGANHMHLNATDGMMRATAMLRTPAFTQDTRDKLSADLARGKQVFHLNGVACFMLVIPWDQGFNGCLFSRFESFDHDMPLAPYWIVKYAFFRTV